MLIKLYGTLRLYAPGDRFTVMLAPGARVSDALEALFQAAPGVREHILQAGKPELLPHVNVMLKGRLVRDLQGLETPVTDGDVLAIFPPSAGG